ncbi:MAG: HNH endonuclease [Pseudonocardiaceae bacterium]
MVVRLRNLVHHLVLTAFVEPRPPGKEGRHLDRNPGNNHLSNLRWSTHSENQLDQIRHGTHYERNRTHCPLNHLLAPPNLVTSQAARGHRNCLACARARANAQRARERGDALNFRSAADLHYARIMAA